MCPNAARLDIVLTHLLIEAVEFLLQQRHRGARDFTSLRIDREGPEEIVAAGFDRAVVDKVLRMVSRAEYKRRQSPIGPKVTKVAFGRDWRFPVTNKYRL